MSVTSGFFNSVNNDRMYNAEQFAEIFDGVIVDGVFKSVGDGLVVTPVSGLTVSVGPGRAWFNHTWTLNDAAVELTLTAAEELQDRIDAIVLEVNRGDSVRANTLKVVKGTPSSSPEPPAMVKDDVHEKWQYPLAYIYVAANATTLVTGNITDMRGEDECPYAVVVEDMSDIRSYAYISGSTIYIGSKHITPLQVDGNSRLKTLVKANSTSMENLNNVMLRDIYAGTDPMENGQTNLTTGAIYLQYETE